LIQDKLIFGGVAGSSTSEKMGEVLCKKTCNSIEKQGGYLRSLWRLRHLSGASNSRLRDALQVASAMDKSGKTGTHSEAPLIRNHLERRLQKAPSARFLEKFNPAFLCGGFFEKALSGQTLKPCFAAF
jgi:hypothetical protein